VSSWIERPSPNYDPRREGCPIDILVLHYTGMRTAEEALERLCDPAAKVSSHYTIDRDGRIYRHVDESLRARHAGVSWWAGERDVNSRSIGIELVNPGHEFGYLAFPEPQIEALIELARGILARHPIPPHRVVGHSDVAPVRKTDPGELFPWQHLAENGIGIFPPPCAGEVARVRAPEGGVTLASMRPSASLRYAPLGTSPAHGGGKDFAMRLAAFGYGVSPDVDVPLATVITAFQRHFRPEKIDGVADAETGARLAALLEMME
jgi:N-acetylmuramoyl-L-alanine amidase